MAGLSRRGFLGGAAATAAAATLGAPRAHAQKKGGTIRFIPHADLKVLDPIATTAYITRNHAYFIYDTLFGTDEHLAIKPQMVDKYASTNKGLKWSFTLRDGLKFHDGAAVAAEDAVESLKRWSKRDPLGRLLAAHTAKLAPADKKTFTLELSEPFGLVLDALGKPSSNVPFIMPARIAATSENEPIKETIGSGPFKFVKDEWQPGNQVVYVKNPDYVPRQEKPSGSTGGKVVHLDRVVWRYMPDHATANAALEAGEIDWWENPPLDFVPKIEANPALATFVTDPRGTQGWIRPNHKHPPFNNKKARQALLLAVDQKSYLQAVIGNEKYFKTCPSVFMCGGLPYESSAGAPKPDLERARALFKESGYDGRPVVVLDPTDSPYAHAPALVTMEMLKSIGANVDLHAMDWSTMVSRRAKKEPPAQGGWNVFHTWSTSFDTMTPAVSSVLGGAGEKAWFGWPTSEAMEKLRADFAREPNEAKRRAIAEKVQVLAYDEVPYVPWGQFVIPGAFRKNVHGVLQFGATLLWNIQV